MRAYSVRPSDDTELCQPLDVKEFDSYVWSPTTGERLVPEVRIVHVDDLGRRLGRSDAPFWTAHALVFRKEAIRALESTIGAAGSVRSLRCREDELVIFRSAHSLDLLSEKSNLMTLSDGTVIGIMRAVPKQDVEITVPVFGLKVWGDRSPMYVDESFVAAWRTAGLAGLEFDLLW